jgi:hypothetical protein
MPGMSEHLGDLRSSQSIELGKGLCGLIDDAFLDFTHLTVLMYLVRTAKGPCGPSDIADVIGDPKKAVQAVLVRFE